MTNLKPKRFLSTLSSPIFLYKTLLLLTPKLTLNFPPVFMNKVPLPTGRPYIMKSTKSCKLMQTAFSCDVQPPNHWCLPIRGDRKVAQPAPDIIWVLGMSAAFSDARMMNSFLHVWWDAMTQWRERAHETGYRRHGTGQPAEMHPRTHRGEVR